MNAVIKEENEVPACACDDPVYKAQMEGLKQMTTVIKSWCEFESSLQSRQHAPEKSAGKICTNP